MSKRRTILLSIVIILAGVAITSMVFLTEPEARQEGAVKKSAMLVDVIPVQRDDFNPTVVATGTVQPAKDITLSPRVAGQVISVSEQFTPGATVRKGTVLLRIDPADYENTLRLRMSDLQLARAALKVEMGRQDVAKKDYELIGDELSPENKALVLREPQLESARANIAAAEAAVKQAELNLERTTIRAPFDAHIITRNANEGSLVTPGDNLGRMVGLDEYWIVANVPVAKVNWLTFGEEANRPGSGVKILNENAWPSGQFRTGKLFRLVGALNDQTRLARVIISVRDPLNTGRRDTAPPLMIGTFVQAHIQARQIQQVIRLDRDYLRKNKTVWVMEDGKLRIREVDIVFEDAEYAYISEGLLDSEMVVTTNLSTVVDGSELRVEGMPDADTIDIRRVTNE